MLFIPRPSWNVFLCGVEYMNQSSDIDIANVEEDMRSLFSDKVFKITLWDLNKAIPI